jgi:NAD(P)-dependent dehydrogenase (short-subunit alcohol dehydrogenase family)
MPYSLRNRNVLITGGSRGLGAVVAEKFAAAGANVAVNYVSREAPALELAARLEREYGVRTTAIQGVSGYRKSPPSVVVGERSGVVWCGGVGRGRGEGRDDVGDG